MVAWLVLAGALLAQPAAGQSAQAPKFEAYVPPEIRNIGVDEHRGDVIPLDLTFQNDRGENVRLGDLFSPNKPVILQLGYYGCPMLCGEVSKGLVDGLNVLNLRIGKDYELLYVSIDPREDWRLARLKKQSYAESLIAPEAAVGMHFLTTSDEQTIRQLTDATGFRFQYIPSHGEYSHPAVIVILTPDGSISRYMYGVNYVQQASTLRLSLVEASASRIGSALDQLILTCFAYSHETGKYAVRASALMKLGGALTVVVMGVTLGALFLSERRRGQLALATSPSAVPSQPDGSNRQKA